MVLHFLAKYSRFGRDFLILGSLPIHIIEEFLIMEYGQLFHLLLIPLSPLFGIFNSQIASTCATDAQTGAGATPAYNNFPGHGYLPKPQQLRNP